MDLPLERVIYLGSDFLVFLFLVLKGNFLWSPYSSYIGFFPHHIEDIISLSPVFQRYHLTSCCFFKVTRFFLLIDCSCLCYVHSDYVYIVIVHFLLFNLLVLVGSLESVGCYLLSALGQSWLSCLHPLLLPRSSWSSC